MPKSKTVNKLSDMQIDEVSLVDRGANQHATVAIHKRLEDEEIDKADPDQSTVTGTPEEDDEVIAPSDDSDEEKRENTSEGDKDKGDEELDIGKGFWQKLISKFATDQDPDGTLRDEEGESVSDEVSKAPGFPPKQQQGQPGMQVPYGMAPQGAPAPGPQGFLPQQQAFPAGGPPGMPQQMPGQMQAGPPLPQEVIDYIQNLEQALMQAQGKDPSDPSSETDDNDKPFGKRAGDDDMSDTDTTAFLSELAKNLESEEQQEAISKALEEIAKANERAARAEEIAEFEKNHRETREYVAKAQSWVNLPVDPEEFGPVLKRLHDAMEDEDVAMIEKALTASNSAMADAGLFTEVGKRGSGLPGDGPLEGIVKNLQDATPGLTREQAITKALEADPSLYDEAIRAQG